MTESHSHRHKKSRYSKAKTFSNEAQQYFEEIIPLLIDMRIPDIKRKQMKADFKKINDMIIEIDNNLLKSVTDDINIAITNEMLKILPQLQYEFTTLYQMPSRIDFITSTYIDIIKVGLVTDKLFENLPVTAEFRKRSPKLTIELSSSYITIASLVKDLYINLLIPGNINTSLMDQIQNELNDLFEQLPVKYSTFTYIKDKDTPTPFLKDMEKYLKRLYKKISALKKNIISSNNLFESFNGIYGIIKGIRKIVNAGEIPALSVQKLNSDEVLTKYPFLTGPAELIDYNIAYESQTVVTRTKKSDKIATPWFLNPKFFDLDKVIERMQEYSVMLHAINKKEFVPIDAPQPMGYVEGYGAKDVIEERTKCYREHINELSRRIEANKAFDKYTHRITKNIQNIDLESVVQETKEFGQESLNVYLETKEKLDNEFLALLTEKEEFEGKIAEQMAFIDSAGLEAQKITRDIIKQQNKAIESQCENEKIAAELAEMKKAREELERNLQELIEQTDETRRSTEQIQKEIDEEQEAMETENEEFKKNIHKLRDEYSKLEGPLEALPERLEELLKKRERLEADKIPKQEDTLEKLMEDLVAVSQMSAFAARATQQKQNAAMALYLQNVL